MEEGLDGFFVFSLTRANLSELNISLMKVMGSVVKSSFRHSLPGQVYSKCECCAENVVFCDISKVRILTTCFLSTFNLGTDAEFVCKLAELYRTVWLACFCASSSLNQKKPSGQFCC